MVKIMHCGRSFIRNCTVISSAVFMFAAGVAPTLSMAQETASNDWHCASEIVTDCDMPDGFARLLFPDGRKKALVVSCDDGRIYDRKVVEILNKHGMRGTFNLVSNWLDKDGYLTRAEIVQLFAGHEVACHTVSHRSLTTLTDEQVRDEIANNRTDLEHVAGHPVRGLAYPSGDVDDRVAGLMPALGLTYARCVGVNHWFKLPSNPYLWITTCNFCKNWMDDATVFLARTSGPSLMLVWGHSFDFAEDKSNYFTHDDKWNQLEDFCNKVGGHDDIWYTTCIEVMDYVNAAKSMQISASGNFIKNPGTIPIWLEINGRMVEVKAGETVTIDVSRSKAKTAHR